jgi:hypothetical protein
VSGVTVLEQETEHFHRAILKLVGPFWGKPRIAALLAATVARVQELEDATWEVMIRYTIDGADTARLDVLGKIVGQPRFWADDEIYRAVIRAKIRANRSRGLTDDIIQVIQLAAAVTTMTFVDSYAPATARVVLGEPINVARQVALAFLLPKTRPAGVQLHLSRPVAAVASSLTWGSSRTGGGGDFGSARTGGGDSAYSVRIL